jgi:hypothetical protein
MHMGTWRADGAAAGVTETTFAVTGGPVNVGCESAAGPLATG